MPYTRHVDEDGILVTETTGTLTFEDMIGMLEELPKYSKDKQIYEIVLHSDNTKIDVPLGQTYKTRDFGRELFDVFTKGAIAVVTDQDFIFGVCSQFQMLVNSDKVEFHTFRSKEEGYQWVRKMKGIEY